VGRHFSRANLAIMPAVREGFGLIGWEAIGCEVPLILGDQSGLRTLLDRALDGHSDRWVTAVPLTGRDLDERDVTGMADAIVEVPRDLEHARQRATGLRRLLKDRFDGCTWPAAAQRFLDARGLAPGVRPAPSVSAGQAATVAGPSSVAPDRPAFRATPSITVTVARSST
jgi:hypothetical protein